MLATFFPTLYSSSPVLEVPKKAPEKRKSNKAYDVLAKAQSKRKGKLPDPQLVAKAKRTVRGVIAGSGRASKAEHDYPNDGDSERDDIDSRTQGPETFSRSGSRATRNSLKAKTGGARKLGYYKGNQHLVVATARVNFRLCLVTTTPFASRTDKLNMAKAALKVAVTETLGTDVESDSEDIPPLTEDLINLARIHLLFHL